MKKKHIIIVGGGASGLVAAIAAARRGATVTIIEQKDRVGKKILSTGNGRCNLTNEYMELKCFHGDDTTVVPEVLEQFGYQETLHFFEELGVILKSRQGYIYPVSDQATTILDVLRMEIERLGVELILEESVCSVKKTKKGFQVQTKKGSYMGDAVILATGGKAASVLGSDGSGYGLAKSFGHSISPVVPALVQLIGKGAYFKQLSGVRTNAKVSVFVDGRYADSDTGELQLTNYGISGIPVFQVSRHAAKALQQRRRVSTELNFMPNLSEKELITFLMMRRAAHGYKTSEDFLVGMFHKKLTGVFLKEAKIPFRSKAENLSDKQLEKLAWVLQHFYIEIEDTNSFDQAQVCAGGVRTGEVNARTMESVFERGLYLTGELLDIDGICGGYNLQWAWATGYLAGSNAAE